MISAALINVFEAIKVLKMLKMLKMSIYYALDALFYSGPNVLRAALRNHPGS